MPTLDLEELGPERADLAYPLIRMVTPDVTAERWREYAGALVGGGGGLLAVLAGQDSLHGIAAFRIMDALSGRVLQVEVFVTFELSAKAPVRRTLLNGLERRAAAAGCTTLSLSLPSRGYLPDESDKAKGWSMLGLAPQGVAFAKRLPVHQVHPAP